MTKQIEKKSELLDKLFRATVFVKGVDGIFEVIGGVSLFFIKPATIDRIVILLTQHELSTDPDDFLANHLIQLTHNLSIHSEIVGGIYLLLHGVTKIIIAVALLKNNLHAYKFALGFLLISFFYELYRLLLGHSPLMLFLSAFDGVIIWLVLKEHNRLKNSMIEE